MSSRLRVLVLNERDPLHPRAGGAEVHVAEISRRLAERGFEVGPGEMGENVTTRGLDLLALPTGTLLRLGEAAVVELTGLRNPCKQLDGLCEGLMNAVLDRDADGGLVRKSGVMGVVLAGGTVRPGDAITIALPVGDAQALEPV